MSRTAVVGLLLGRYTAVDNAYTQNFLGMLWSCSKYFEMVIIWNFAVHFENKIWDAQLEA